MLTIKGTCVSGGVAIAPLRFLQGGAAVIREIVADIEAETDRFEKARLNACAQLDELYQTALEKVGEANAAIFDVHKMMLEDLDYCEFITDLIRAESVSAAYAVSMASKNFAEMFSSMDDPYMKARAADVRDVSERVQRSLNPEKYEALTFDAPVILAARDITPGDAVQLDKDMILGFATSEGSVTSHTSILAKSMAIPALIGAGGELGPELDGRPAILDGFTGELYVEPDAATSAAMARKQRETLEKRESLNALIGCPNVTLDGKEIEVFANLNHLSDLDEALRNDAEGVGLFRSEFLYLEGAYYPTEQEQFEAYKKVAEGMNGRKVVIRTLDVGADKQADYFNLPHEENPAMGLRAIRICLTRPQIFKTQLRALYRASAFGHIAIMFPMIISVREVEEILKIAEGVKEELRRENTPFDERLETGIMIETPAAVMIGDALARMVDFFSVGTNDLTQYTLAVDRQNSRLGDFYDAHHPAVLRLIETAVKSAHDAGIWIGICGELGADLEMTETFLRMGVDELSVSPRMILPLRERIRGLDLDA